MASTVNWARARLWTLRRISAAVFAIWAATINLGSAGVALAGPGHDHGPADAATGSPPSPRVVATSEAYQFVGIAEGEVLVIYLDRAADNAPVTDAVIEVTIADQAQRAELQQSGTYEVTSAVLKTPGDHSVVVNIVEGSSTDLLVGSIVVPRLPQDHDDAAHTIWSHLNLPSVLPVAPMQAAGLFLGGVLVLASMIGLASRRRGAAVAGIVIGLAVVVATSAYAHEGHDHGAPASGANGNAPYRRPDGSIFLPKPTQRLLDVRTRIVAPETAMRTLRFQGRVVANPNRSGVVQSTIQGRFAPPSDGVPPVGTRVMAGDLLGRIAPSFVAKESSDMAQTLAELDGQIALARSKLNRQEQLLRTNTVSRAVVDEIKIQLDGFLKRREDLLDARIQPEELRAPVDGVITAVRVVSGQVVSPNDQLFQIVDPSSLFVEAMMFDQAQADRVTDAVATFNGGKTAQLRFLGRSRSLQAQSAILKFELLDPPTELNVGSPVIVFAATGEPVTGLRLPRASVAQAPNGQPVVFVHKEPEVFEARAVRFEPFDAETVMIAAGLKAGEKVVVQNAPLVNQVR